MKGDVYDDGTPNPLVVKCPNCGGENITGYIGTGSVKYRCNACGEEFSYTSVTGCAVSDLCPNCGAMMRYDYIHGTRYCTRCGCMVMSDKTEETKEQNISAQSPKYGWICPKCGKVYAPDIKECSICNYLANINASGRINQTSSAETHIEGVLTATSTQEKHVGLDGSFVIDKSLFPNLNLTKDSTVYAGGGGTRWNKAEDEKRKGT